MKKNTVSRFPSLQRFDKTRSVLRETTAIDQQKSSCLKTWCEEFWEAMKFLIWNWSQICSKRFSQLQVLDNFQSLYVLETHDSCPPDDVSNGANVQEHILGRIQEKTREDCLRCPAWIRWVYGRITKHIYNPCCTKIQMSFLTFSHPFLLGKISKCIQ